MITQTYIPGFPLNQFIDFFFYYEGYSPSHSIERFLPDGNASLLAGISLNGGKPVYGSTDDLLENQFAKAEAMREAYESVINFVQQNFPAATVLPKKTYVSILEKREFAAINIKPKEVRIGFDLGDRPFDDTVTHSKLTGPMPRISHMMVVTGKEFSNKEMLDLLRESHKRTHS